MGAIAKLRFVHLSDIHFSNKTPKFGFDPDEAIRTAVANDISQMCGRLGPATAILVSGDIAFSGKREEYENAGQWLGQICANAQCGPEKVLICPGNHDVDQDVIRKNALIADGHESIKRGNSNYAQNHALNERLNQPAACSLVYETITAFNEFAARYESSFFATSDSFAWERNFDLNDGSTLRIRGLNSALLSGLNDLKGKLFLGERAYTLPSHQGVEYLVMAHHPPNWLLDEREAEGAFNYGARIHLFGHEHDQRVIPGRDWIKLFAGAINPHRSETNWRPGYNIIEIWVEQDNSSRYLMIEVHAREWQGSPPRFHAIEDDDRDTFNVRIKLKDLPHGFRHKHDVMATVQKQPEPDTANKGVETTTVDPNHRFRIVVYRFFKLSLSQKNEIVGIMKLAEDSDSRLTDVERHKLSLQRAKEHGRLDEIEQLMDKLEQQ